MSSARLFTGNLLWLVMLLIGLISCSSDNEIPEVSNQDVRENWVVRFAELEIDSAKLDEYNEFLREGIKTATEIEPGVLTMYAVQEADDPTKITVLEIYESDSAYQAHLATPHFQKYKTGTAEMVKSLKLIDLNPIVLRGKNIN